MPQCKSPASFTEVKVQNLYPQNLLTFIKSTHHAECHLAILLCILYIILLPNVFIFIKVNIIQCTL